ncbi:hypothetical protein T439DRAFT_324895 [Meredithblackwellia eburnea MCA 4105]
MSGSAPTFSPFPPPPAAKAAPYFASTLPTFLSPLANVLDRIDAARDRLNLPDPGKSEDLGREAKNTHLTNFIFDGARAELSKTLSQTPAFQVTHSFLAGSQGGPMGGVSPGTYNFGALFATQNAFLHGMVDNDGILQARAHYGWSTQNTTKFSVVCGPNSLFTIEQDRVGKDYTLNLKAMNPSPADLSGMYFANYLQSVTPGFALGADVVYQRQAPGVEDCQVGYSAKWHNVKKDEQGQSVKDSWVATAQILPQGLLQGTYWQKLAPSVEAAAEIQIIPALNPRERKAVATAALKYEYRASSFRGQVDSTGKISALLEQRLSPAFSFLFGGEIDHVKNTSKFGVGVQIESADEAVMEQAAAAQANGPPPI